MTPAVEIQDLGYGFEPGRLIFEHCSARIERGAIAAILGPNGSGKTTLLQLLLGSLQPSSGSAAIHAQPAFVPQLFTASFDYSVLDVVLMGRARHIRLFSQPSREDERRSLRMLARFGLDGMAQRPFYQLSGGERQLVTFARALVSEAELLLLDEPTSALDLGNQALALGWLQKLAREEGLAIIFTTHQAQHAFAIADQVLLMLRGEPPLFGPAQQVLSEQNLLRLYGVPLKRVCFPHEGVEHETIVPIFPLLL